MALDFSLFFDPVVAQEYTTNGYLPTNETLWVNTHFVTNAGHWLDMGQWEIVLIGIEDDRQSTHIGTAKAATQIRKQLYKLSSIEGLKLVDLGTLKQGETPEDTIEALQTVCSELLQRDLIVLVIGSGQEFSYPMAGALAQVQDQFNLITIDPRYDIQASNPTLTSQNYLLKIITDYRPQIFNITNIGNQNYYNSTKENHFFNDKLFETIRLGNTQNDMKAIEPSLRDTDMISIDISAIRQSDAPGHSNASPNGFYGEEICKILRYAGMSINPKIIGIFELNPDFDRNNQSAQLLAQILWHYLEGTTHKPTAGPLEASENYKEFIVRVENIEDGLKFYKNKTTEHWWLEIKYTSQKKEQKKIIACNESDYHTASQNEIPDIWWRTLQKIKQQSSEN